MIGYKYNGYNQHPWAYYDIDVQSAACGRQMTSAALAPRVIPSGARDLLFDNDRR